MNKELTIDATMIYAGLVTLCKMSDEERKAWVERLRTLLATERTSLVLSENPLFTIESVMFKRKREIIKRFCLLSAQVMHRAMECEPADCFCGDIWSPQPSEDTYRFSDSIIDFIESATMEKLDEIDRKKAELEALKNPNKGDGK